MCASLWPLWFGPYRVSRGPKPARRPSSCLPHPPHTNTHPASNPPNNPPAHQPTTHPCNHPPNHLPPAAQLADFGLARVLSDGAAALNVDGAGTANHLAPELFLAGSRVTTAVDAYAFGVMIWECYTQRRAFQGGGA